MLICNACGAKGLKIVASLELGADALWDERSIQTAECPVCSAHFRAHYHEERRGAREHVTHEAFLISEALFARMTDAIRDGKGAEAELFAAAEVAEGESLAFENKPGMEALSRLSSPLSSVTQQPSTRGALFSRLFGWLKN